MIFRPSLRPASSGSKRAVSAIARLISRPIRAVPHESHEYCSHTGMHAGEQRAFAIAVPFTVLVAVAAFLIRELGLPWGILLAAPSALLILHTLPFLLFCRFERGRFYLWMIGVGAWAVYAVHAEPLPVNYFAGIWLSYLSLEILALGVLAIRGWIRRSGARSRIAILIVLHGIALALGFQLGWEWGLGTATAVGLGWWANTLLPNSQAFGPVIQFSAKPLITIDDGPDPEDTPVLLDLLDRYETKAIFFLIGEKVRRYPEIAREIVRRGHAIGNHTMTHPQASFWCAGPSRTQREISNCQQAIEEITEVRAAWFRAPVGHVNLFTHPACDRLGLEVMGWSRRGYDAVGNDPAPALTRLLKDLRGDEIILLHEATPIAETVTQAVLEKLTKTS